MYLSHAKVSMNKLYILVVSKYTDVMLCVCYGLYCNWIDLGWIS